MSENNDQTNPGRPEFDFSRYPVRFALPRTTNRRRSSCQKRPSRSAQRVPATTTPPRERRAKKDRRRRIDPTTFDKQYSDDEMEFMNAMQRFKEISGKSFPTFREVLKIVVGLGYRRVVIEPDDDSNARNSTSTRLRCCSNPQSTHEETKTRGPWPP